MVHDGLDLLLPRLVESWSESFVSHAHLGPFHLRTLTCCKILCFQILSTVSSKSELQHCTGFLIHVSWSELAYNVQLELNEEGHISTWKDLHSFCWNVVQDDEHIKTVTQEFCEWVASLGGDSNNIEESTITSLFASGYETKPALSVPIHVVELANVPPELRMAAAPTQLPLSTRVNSAGSSQQREVTKLFLG